MTANSKKKKVPQRKVTKPVEDYSSWISKFKSAEDAGNQYKHNDSENPAYGSFGYLKNGHLKEAYTKSATFAPLRKKYKTYEDLWKAVESGSYEKPEIAEIDKTYAQWLGKRHKGDLFSAAKFNLTGSATPPSDWAANHPKNMSPETYAAKVQGVTATTAQTPQPARSLPTSPNVDTPLNEQGIPIYNRKSVNGEVDPRVTGAVPPASPERASTMPPTSDVKLMANPWYMNRETAKDLSKEALAPGVNPNPLPPVTGIAPEGTKEGIQLNTDVTTNQFNDITPIKPGEKPRQTPQLPPYRTSGVPYLSNILNSFRQPAAVPSPIYENQIQLERQNMDSDRNEVRRGMNTTFRSLDNSMDAQTAGLMKLGALGQSVNQLSAINQNERNTNIGIANQEATINRQVSSSNADRLAAFNAEQAARKNTLTSARSENIANAVGKYMGMQDQKNAYNMENFKAQLEFGKDEYGTLKRSILDEELKKAEKNSKTFSETFLDKLKAKKPGELTEKKWGGYTAGRMIKRMNLKPII